MTSICCCSVSDADGIDSGHAFISYVREDSQAVDRLQELLESAGIPVWRDTASLWPGQDWRDMLRRAITGNALVFIACFSRNSLVRDRSCQREELALAIEQLRQHRPGDPWFFPVRFDDCEIPDLDIGADRTLASIQRADLFGNVGQEGAADLVAAVLRILSPRARPVRATATQATLPHRPAAAPVVAVAMMPDAPRAVTVAEDGTVRSEDSEGFWYERIEAGKPVAAALSVAFPTAVLWATETTLMRYRLPFHPGGGSPAGVPIPVPSAVCALALSPDGDLAVAAFSDGTLRALDIWTREFGPVLAAEPLAARAVALASHRGPVIAIFADGSIRRYDLWTRASDHVGIDQQARAVAGTADGNIVITAGADGIVRRWNPRLGRPPDIFHLDEAITAIAVDSTGGKVLAGTAAGVLWLLDLTDGSRTRQLAADVSQLPPNSRGSFGRVVDDDVRFTVYRPQVLLPEVWASLLVFAHKTTPVEEPGKAPIDPNDLVEAQARAHFGDKAPRPVGEDARHGLIRGAQLRIVPDLPGIGCNPVQAEIDWREPVHEVMFRLLAGAGLAGTVVRGAVRIWCGPLLLGEVSLTISVARSGAAAGSQQVADSAPRYRKIFPSYAREDRVMVTAFAEAARVLGDQYLQDVLALRVGERWEAGLLELIDDADVFQLFWSRNSMHSRHCQAEWEHALALRRPSFVRPLYWEEPLPADPGRGLPPEALRELHFVKVLVDRLAPVRPRAEPLDHAAQPGAPTSDASPSLAPPQGHTPSDIKALPRHNIAHGARIAAAMIAGIAAVATAVFLVLPHPGPAGPAAHAPTQAHPAPPPSDSFIVVLMLAEAGAAQAHDISTVREIYAPSAFVRDAGCRAPARTWRGLAQIVMRYQNLGVFSSLSHDHIQVRFIPDTARASRAAATAETVGSINPSATNPRGQPLHGHETWTFALENGRWVITSFTFDMCG